MYGRGHQSLGFGPPFTPPVIQQLLIALAACFVAQTLVPGFADLGMLRPAQLFERFHVWQPFSYMWLHGGLGHLLLNGFSLWMFGSQLALLWGPQRFLRFYLACGVGAGLIIGAFPYLEVWIGLSHPQRLWIPTLGASGAIYGVLLAYSLTWPDRTIALMFPPVAFRAIWLIPVLFVMTALTGPANVSHIGHLGGVVVGWFYLRREGMRTPTPSWRQLQHRWKRFRMRQKLRAVQYEEYERERKRRDSRFH